MKIEKNIEGTVLKVKIEGSIDTVTSPEVEKSVKESIDGITDIRFDFTDVEYVSSAGLRVLLVLLKLVNGKGSVILSNVNDEVMEVLKITAFINILVVE